MSAPSSSQSESAAPHLSVVVPTFKEAENLPHLAKAVDDTLREAKMNYEIIIADDNSPDGTAEICEELKKKYPLHLLTRKANPGLSAAVVDGANRARGKIVAVMDADLSHSPSVLPKMAAALDGGEADFVLGSRYVSGGAVDGEWSWWRRFNSWGATLPALPLAPVRDPMSGFFALRREDLPPRENLSPIGYKIGLEIMVKAGFARRRIVEIPIYFRDRQFGESKMTLREQINYLRHLWRLYRFRMPRLMAAGMFCAVGAAGVLVDLAVYGLGLAAGMDHRLARAISFWPAVTFNWFFNRRLTFSDRPRAAAGAQWAQFASASLAGFVVNFGVYVGLTSAFSFFAQTPLWAFAAGIVAGTAFNFIAADRLVFAAKKGENAARE